MCVRTRFDTFAWLDVLARNTIDNSEDRLGRRLPFLAAIFGLTTMLVAIPLRSHTL